MSKSERSAGFIVFRRDDTGRRFYLLLDYGRFWDYPKGHVEKGEDDLAAALRELDEETGLRDVAVIDGFSRELKYFFRKGKTLIRKTVAFFLAESPTDKVKVSHEHSGHEWLPADEAIARVTYPSSRRVLEEAEAFLKAKQAP
ncbi:MAG TPA: bis(5'-nucleosyl)-tetraphosphatase [Tepidisphaeraceae bacterium]|jgi:8-oxo-dGTP pyrophosphatase MutT (NUDIX family)|nr:bis(5'-nucleosyl)-tetraphosphatase [Tepidisphaeraceae bacterium]